MHFVTFCFLTTPNLLISHLKPSSKCPFISMFHVICTSPLHRRRSSAEAERFSSLHGPNIGASLLPDLLCSYLREFGSASSIDELAAEIHGLGGVRRQLLLHSHFLTRDACRKPKKRGRVRITCKTRTTSEYLQHVGAERKKKSRQRESTVALMEESVFSLKL